MRKPVVHFEIGCDNLAETVEFYKEVFNWTNNSEPCTTLIQNPYKPLQ